ncbi:MAG: putative phage related protein [Pedosphaera sp.]|nr:putative phage related protein [Pedosphaera sp.]
MMRVAVLFESSGAVRDALIRRGHFAVSFDLLPTEWPGPHVVGDVTADLAGGEFVTAQLAADVTADLARVYAELDVTAELARGWDMVIAFPPCTFLSRAGAHLWRQREAEALAAYELVRLVADLRCERIAIENPVGLLTRFWRAPDQYIQPWWFGEPYQKRTGLWLKGLAPLKPTQITGERRSWVAAVGESRTRARERSRTFLGVADAMAAQWAP